MGKHVESHGHHGESHGHHGHHGESHHNHHHEPPFRIPDYKEFKIEGIKELENVQQKLAAKGLKDPWLR